MESEWGPGRVRVEYGRSQGGVRVDTGRVRVGSGWGPGAAMMGS